MHDTMLEKYSGSFLRSRSPLEEQGHHYLTPYAFKKFQDEFGKAFQYSIQEENCTTFIVNHHKATRHQTVFWDGKVAICSCKYFEFVGILCCHILRVLVHKDCFEIPSMYWLSRWRREDQLQDTSPLDQEATLMDSTPLNNSQLGPLSTNLVQRPPKSTQKGRPKKIRPKGGNEFTKQVRRCTYVSLLAITLVTVRIRKILPIAVLLNDVLRRERRLPQKTRT